MSQRGTKSWVICCAGNIKGAVEGELFVGWVSDQECRWEWSGLTALESNTGCKNAQRNGNAFELQGTAHSWSCRQLLGYWVRHKDHWLFPTFSGGQDDTTERTKFCYQIDNISENLSRKLPMDLIAFGRFHSHSSCFLQKLHEAALRWISIFKDQLGYGVLGLPFFLVKPITQHP